MSKSKYVKMAEDSLPSNNMAVHSIFLLLVWRKGKVGVCERERSRSYKSILETFSEEIKLQTTISDY